MKTCVLMIVLVGWVVAGAGQEPGFHLEGQGSATIPVTLNKMTNLVFPCAVRVGVKVSSEVLAQKVRGVENVIELKAMRRGFLPTNLSVYGADGRLYSFVLRYVEDTAVLNYRVILAGSGASVRLSGLPASMSRLAADTAVLAKQRAFLRVSTRGAGLRLRLNGIWLRDSLQWFCFVLKNRSAVAFVPVRMRCYFSDQERINRRAVQEVELHAVYGGVGTVAGRARQRFAVGFEPFTVPSGKRLIVELVGQDGRQLVLRIKGREVLRMREAMVSR